MPEAVINSGDTAFVLIAAAMVMVMTPALGFFYGGLVNRKNVLSTLMHSFFILALISVVWTLWGYTLAFGPDKGGIIGGLDYIGLKDITPSDVWTPYAIPTLASVACQMMFAAITPALISGAFAERKNFKAVVLFSLVWSTVIYAPLAHWVWGGGWLFDLGALDFAGGTVIHISSGVAALVCAIVLGKRKTFRTPDADPHNLTLTVLGAGLLWFGWFGFNAGSALGATGQAASAFLVTNIAAAAGALAWMSVSWVRHGHPSVLGAAAGAVAGLVAITPAAGFVGPASAVLIGVGAGVFCPLALDFVKDRLGIDDALDVFAVHGIGGIWGALATGLFADKAYSGGEGVGFDGLFFGEPAQLWYQLVAVGAAVAFSGIGTFVILKAINVFFPLRVTEELEVLGLDASLHGEAAYQL